MKNNIIQCLFLYTWFIIALARLGNAYQKYISPTSLQNMVVNKQDGKIYLGSTNKLYIINWLSSSVRKEREVTTGPVKDNIYCLPPPIYQSMCPDKYKLEDTDNLNKVLILNKDNSYLITCGSVFQGSCQLRTMSDLSTLDNITTQFVAANSVTGSTVAFIAPGPTYNHADVMYVGTTASERNSGIKGKVPAVCSRSLQGSELFKVEMDQEIRLEDFSYLIDYVYGFASGQYSYFVTVQGKDIKKDSYHSRIVRLCQKDDRYASYLEMPLECKNGSTLYNLVQGAYVANPGKKLADSLGITVNDDVLFATFSKSIGNTSKPSSTSALCVFSIKYLNSQFIQNIKQCNSQTQIDLGLPWFMNADSKCKKETGTIDSNYCSNSQSANTPLGGELSASSSTVMTYSQATIESITAMVYKQGTAVFLGTKTGHLLKVAVNSKSTVNEPYDDTTLDSNSGIIQLALALDKIHVYAMTDKQIFKVPVQECDKHSNCGTCLGGGDPFCGWCTLHGRCSIAASCPDSVEPRFIDTYSKCVKVSSISPEAVPITEQVTLDVKMANIPVPSSGNTYKCFIHGKQMSSTYNDASSVLSCNTPSPSSLPAVTEKGAIWLSLSLFATETGVNFFSTKVPFYDCTTYDSCMDCAESPYPCGWCIYENKCTASKSLSSQCSTDNVPWVGPSPPGASICPRLLPSSTESLLHVGVSKELQIKGSRLPATRSDHQYTCELTDDSGQVYSTSATRPNENLITCQPRKYMYKSSSLATYRAKVAVKWSNKVFIDNPQNVRVTLYKCFVTNKDCSSCLVYNPKYQCGWCKTDSRCDVKPNCGSSWGNQECREIPVITGFSPKSGPTKGGTVVSITGKELGIKFTDIQDFVYIAGQQCIPDKSKYTPSKGFSCTTSAVPFQRATQGSVSVSVHGITGKSQQLFSYRDPVITGFHPFGGPKSGGTEVTVFGKDINTGLVITAKIAGVPCNIVKNSITNSSLVCITTSKNARRRRRAVFLGTVEVTFDGFTTSSHTMYNFTEDPLISQIKKKDGELFAFPSGGYPLDVYGTNLDVVQKPIVRFNNPDDSSVLYIAPCVIISSSQLLCSSPNISAQADLDKAEISFKMDGVKTVQNLTLSLPNYSRVKLLSDPIISDMEKSVQIEDRNDQEVTLKGMNLENLPAEYYVASVGGVKCNITTLADTLLVFIVPAKDLLPDGEKFDVLVQVGLGNLVYSPGFVYLEVVEELGNVMLIIYIVVGVAGLFLLLIIAGLICLYCRKREQQKLNQKTFDQQMTSLESRVAKECREAFAELQTDMTDLTNELSASGIPYLDFRSFAIRVLFPGVEDHVILQEKTAKGDSNWETVHRQLMQLINNKHFLLVFIRTLEAQKNFSMKDRCNIASLLMVILQGRMEYATDILKQLLSELIRKSVSRSHPKLLLRRTESIAEKMLTNWLTFCMYGFIKMQAGEPLFLLFRAIKGQVGKGPIDCVSGEARYSLSEDKLLRQTIEYNHLEVTVESDEGSPITVELLDTDTISQAKEKILDTVYRNAPVSSQLCRDALDLEWHRGKQSIKCLYDDDSSSVLEGEWRRLNTLKHYQVPTGACLKLVAHQSTLYTTSSSRAELHESSFLPSMTFSPKSYTPMLSQSAIDLADEGGGKIWHLVKPTEHTNERDDPRHSKMLSEIYLTRLLATKGTLQKFVDDLFESVFSVGRRGMGPPIPIKFLFDFLDNQAKELNISDSEVLHTWKNNSLPLRFWINMIKNPNFVLDINKSNIVDSCLSVIAQLFMDSCSVAEQRLGKDSPSNKLLYAREIPSYRQRVQRFYDDVQKLPSLSDSEVSDFFAELSMQYNGQFNAENALKEMFVFIKKYQYQIQDALEDAGQTSLATKLEHILASVSDE